MQTDENGRVERVPLCKYYDNLKRKQVELIEKYQDKLLDIEDLYQEGKKEKFCPYFLERKKQVSKSKKKSIKFHRNLHILSLCLIII